MSNKKKLSERVRGLIMPWQPLIRVNRKLINTIADEIAALERRLAAAETILRDTLDVMPGEAIGKKQIVAFLENTND